MIHYGLIMGFGREAARDDVVSLLAAKDAEIAALLARVRELEGLVAALHGTVGRCADRVVARTGPGRIDVSRARSRRHFWQCVARVVDPGPGLTSYRTVREDMTSLEFSRRSSRSTPFWRR